MVCNEVIFVHTSLAIWVYLFWALIDMGVDMHVMGIDIHVGH